MTIYLKCGGKVPIPNGYTVERALEILRDVGHLPTVVKTKDGEELPVQDDEEAA